MSIMWKRVLLSAVIILFTGGSGFFGYRYYLLKKLPSDRSAVFMVDGKVYFGYLTDVESNIVTLVDVYYLKTDDLQSADKKILLVKMGNELHNPQNVMHINRDQVLFWQNIQPNSKINDAIARFQSQPSPTPFPRSSVTQ